MRLTQGRRTGKDTLFDATVTFSHTQPPNKLHNPSSHACQGIKRLKTQVFKRDWLFLISRTDFSTCI